MKEIRWTVLSDIAEDEFDTKEEAVEEYKNLKKEGARIVELYKGSHCVKRFTRE